MAFLFIEFPLIVILYYIFTKHDQKRSGIGNGHSGTILPDNFPDSDHPDVYTHHDSGSTSAGNHHSTPHSFSDTDNTSVNDTTDYSSGFDNSNFGGSDSTSTDSGGFDNSIN